MVRAWLAAFLLIGIPMAHAADMPDPWVEFTANGGLDVRAITVPGATCPKVVADGVTLPSVQRGQPDQADGAYPVQVCVAHTAATTRSLTVDGLPVPVLPRAVRRVVIVGDTGCRLKGQSVQDCNDPAKWPFATVARLAAAEHPDLVIHVGDYHYRETPCPDGQPGCAGSPYGDNWAVWKKDFFDPAAPLLAAAPWVVVRGNHELCNRAGHGWFRLLDPHPDAIECVAMTPPYSLHIDTLDLLMLDGADADDDKADPAKVALYRAQLQTLLANAPNHAWLVTHRPIWALNQGEGVKPGDTINPTEQAAIRGLVPRGLDVVLTGHIHNFTSYDFGTERPSQLVVGEGGDEYSAIVQPVTAGIMLDGVKVRRAYATEDYGYFVLQRVSTGWYGIVYSVTDRVLARCSLSGRALACHPATH